MISQERFLCFLQIEYENHRKMVRLGRLERPTSCFGGTRSIQLSYSRAHHLYHAFPVTCIVVLRF
jgi:hypothetical protein